MKVTNWRKKIGASLVAAGILAPAAAHALEIPLGDPSFEAYSVPAIGYAYANEYRPTSAWIGNPGDAAGPLDGGPLDSNWIFNAAYAEGGTKRASPRTGNQAIHGRGHYSGQVTSAVFEAGKTYTFSVYAQGDDNSAIIGNPVDGPGWDSRVWLHIYDGSFPFFEPDALIFERFSPAGDRFNQNDFINRPVGISAAQSKALWQKISISHTVYSDSPEVGNPVGVAFFESFDGNVDDASLTVDTTILTLEVNFTNGLTRIVNETGQPVYFDFYQITSSASSLNSSGWSSFQERNLANFPPGSGSGNGWEEAGGASDGGIGELFLTGNSALGAGANVGLGNAYALGDPQDLIFYYGQATSSMNADFDADGDIDGGDFLNWQRGVGSFGPGVTKASGNANTDLTVNGQDLDLWRDQFGNVTKPDATGTPIRGHVRYVPSFAAVVPEPSSVLLAGLGILGVVASRKWK